MQNKACHPIFNQRAGQSPAGNQATVTQPVDKDNQRYINISLWLEIFPPDGIVFFRMGGMSGGKVNSIATPATGLLHKMQVEVGFTIGVTVWVHLRRPQLRSITYSQDRFKKKSFRAATRIIMVNMFKKTY